MLEDFQEAHWEQMEGSVPSAATEFLDHRTPLESFTRVPLELVGQWQSTFVWRSRVPGLEGVGTLAGVDLGFFFCILRVTQSEANNKTYVL